MAAFRVFNVLAGNNVAISGVTIRYGKGSGNGGGGILNYGTLTLTSSTVSNNSANGQGGGILNEGTLTLANSTVKANTAFGNGGGIANLGGATLTLRNTIIAGNATAGAGPDCHGSPSSQGHNLIGNNSGCTFIRASGDLVNVDPVLGPLQDNGGPTLTHALLPGSPAIDAGDDAACPATDQRGVERPAGAACDIGAYEFEGNSPPKAFGQAVATTRDRPVAIRLVGSDLDSGDVLTFIIISLPGSGDLSEDGVSINSVPHALGGDTVAYGPDHGFTGADTFTFRVNDGLVDSAGDGAVTINVIPTCNWLTATIVGTEGPDRITGTSGDDVIVALGGDAAVWGMEGNDTICLGDGVDFADGGSGKDRIYGENGDDTIIGGDGNDRVWGGNGEDVLRGGRGKDRLYGGKHDDILKGGRQKDRLYGGKGSDTLVGGKGNDRLFGNKGDDGLFGRAGNDSHNCGSGQDDIANGGSGTDTETNCESTRQIP